MYTAFPEDRYQFGDPTGHDAMTTIYRARDIRSGRVIVIKVLRDEYSTDPKFVMQFYRGAEAQKEVRHSNVVQAYDYGQVARKDFWRRGVIEGANPRPNRHLPVFVPAIPP